MLTNTQYVNTLQNIGVNPILYKDYQSYEVLYNSYINNYLPLISQSKNHTVRLIFCESCPAPTNGVHPYLNYIFNNINNHTIIKCGVDMYLDRIYKGIVGTNNIHQPITKQQGFNDLIRDKNGSVIIIDLLPTNGIKLNTNIRKGITANPINCIDINKIVSVINSIVNIVNSSNLKIHACFATPPSLNSFSLSSSINQQLTISGLPLAINWSWPFLNINTGQGHAPSWKALCRNVQNGF